MTRHSLRSRRLLQCLTAFVAGVLLLVNGSAASNAAQRRPATSEPTSVKNCLNHDSPPSDYIYEFNSQGHLVTYFCGTSSAGVIHTNDGHPTLDDKYFGACIQLVLQPGLDNYNEQSNGNYLYTSGYFVGNSLREAYVVVIPHSAYGVSGWNVQTAYTSAGSKSNDWKNCGNYAISVGFGALKHLAK